MKTQLVILLVVLGSLLGVVASAAAQPVELDDPAQTYSLVEHGHFVPDLEGRWTADNIDGLAEAARAAQTGVSEERVRSTERFWLVTSVRNDSQETRWVVSLLVSYLPEVALVVEDEEGERILTRSGESTGLTQILPVVGNAQPVILEPGEVNTLYLLVRARPEPGVDPSELVLRSQPAWSPHAFQLTGFVLLCLGAMIAMSLFSLVIWARFRTTTYLWFSLFAATTTLLWATAYGVVQLFWGASFDISLLNFGANASSLVFCTLFVRRLLETYELSAKVDRTFLVVAAAAASLLVAMFVMPHGLTYTLNALAALLVWVLLVGATVYATVRGSREARLLLVAWGVFLVSAFLTIIEGLGASLPTLQVRLWTIGTTAAGMLLMGLTMGSQMRRLLIEKRSAERDARTDALTDLRNRTAFEFDFRKRAAAYNAGRYAEVMVAFMDLDGLKGINDARGHETGDNLLRTFARLLEREFRDDDRAYRLGGDEFVLLLPARSAPEKGEHKWLQMRLEGIIAEVRASGFPEADVSFGLASLSETGGNRKETLARADARMYKNKRRKRI
jgi:diguanylate cyclase (GGDEF)-like protein